MHKLEVIFEFQSEEKKKYILWNETKQSLLVVTVHTLEFHWHLS